MSKKKKHHFIQEAYLKNFSMDGKIFVFDKNNNEVRKKNPHDVFEINNFYRIPIKQYWESINDEEKTKINIDIIEKFGKPFDNLSDDDKNKVEEWIEDYFAIEVEPIFIDAISELRENIGQVILNRLFNPLTKGIKYVLSTCLSFYYCRTKYFRHSLTNRLSNLYKQMIEIEAQLQGLNIRRDSLSVVFSKEQAKMQHLQFISDLAQDDSIIKSIFTRKWTFLINLTKCPFVLSDNILTIKLTEKIPDFYGVGIETFGAEIYCPITPLIMIVLNDPIAFPNLLDGHCYLIKNEEKINNINKFLHEKCFENCVSNNGEYLCLLTGAKKAYD